MWKGYDWCFMQFFFIIFLGLELGTVFEIMGLLRVFSSALHVREGKVIWMAHINKLHGFPPFRSSVLYWPKQGQKKPSACRVNAPLAFLVNYPFGFSLSFLRLFLGIIDSSGIRFYYTPNLRKYDAGVLTVGSATTSWLMIPPQQKSWHTTGFCSKYCTEKVKQTWSFGIILQREWNLCNTFHVFCLYRLTHTFALQAYTWGLSLLVAFLNTIYNCDGARGHYGFVESR